MRLELGTFEVKDIQPAKQTRLDNGTLYVDVEKIRSLILQDDHFKDVQVHLVRPGEKVRIIHTIDAVEPRFKVSGPSVTFPGIMGPPLTGGDGRTHRLAGVAVITAGDPAPGEPTYWQEALIEMSGPGQPFTIWGSTKNVVLDFKPNLDLFPTGTDAKNVITGTAPSVEYNRAISKASLTVASYLAQATKDLKPDRLETFETAPCSPDLLRVAILYQAPRPTLYGNPITMPIATLLHANEVFDGALVSVFRGPASFRPATYVHQNFESAQELCRRHGKDVNFTGIVIYSGATPKMEEKELVSSMACKIARVLHAKAALILSQSDSNMVVDSMLLCRKCEEAGLRTVMSMGDIGTGADDPGMVHFVPEADAIINCGSREQVLELPRVSKVMGGSTILETGEDAQGPLTTQVKWMLSSTNNLAYNHLQTQIV